MKTGLTVACALGERTCETGLRITTSELKRLDIKGDAFRPDWNCTIKSRCSAT